jgi:hypothetical protein
VTPGTLNVSSQGRTSGDHRVSGGYFDQLSTQEKCYLTEGISIKQQHRSVGNPMQIPLSVHNEEEKKSAIVFQILSFQKTLAGFGTLFRIVRTGCQGFAEPVLSTLLYKTLH